MSTRPIDLLKHHIFTFHPLVYMGDKTGGVNHPSRATTLPIFQSFASAYPNIIPHDQGTSAGQSNELYPIFRDQLLPQALREMIADSQGVAVDTIAPTMYAPKKSIVLQTGTHGPRRIQGWQVWTVKNAKYAFARCGLATYYDQEMEMATLDLTMSECDLIDGDCEPPIKRARSHE